MQVVVGYKYLIVLHYKLSEFHTPGHKKYQ